MIERRVTAKNLDADYVLNRLLEEANKEDIEAGVRVKALELLGKYLRMFRDTVDHTVVLAQVKAIGWDVPKPALPVHKKEEKEED